MIVKTFQKTPIKKISILRIKTPLNNMSTRKPITQLKHLQKIRNKKTPHPQITYRTQKQRSTPKHLKTAPLKTQMRRQAPQTRQNQQSNLTTPTTTPPPKPLPQSKQAQPTTSNHRNLKRPNLPPNLQRNLPRKMKKNAPLGAHSTSAVRWRGVRQALSAGKKFVCSSATRVKCVSCGIFTPNYKNGLSSRVMPRLQVQIHNLSLQRRNRSLRKRKLGIQMRCLKLNLSMMPSG